MASWVPGGSAGGTPAPPRRTETIVVRPSRPHILIRPGFVRAGRPHPKGDTPIFYRFSHMVVGLGCILAEESGMSLNYERVSITEARI